LNGKTIDLNGDGIADFVGMGPAGLVYAYGNTSGSGGAYGLGTLQTAHISGGNTDLGEAQGWTDATTLRYIIADSATGYDDILGFGYSSTLVAGGARDGSGNLQFALDPNKTYGDFGSAEGWSGSTLQTIRALGTFPGTGGGSHSDLILSGLSNTQAWHYT